MNIYGWQINLFVFQTNSGSNSDLLAGRVMMEARLMIFLLLLILLLLVLSLLLLLLPL